MKLLELLVKERIEWHPEALCYTQDGDDGRVYPSKTEKPRLDGAIWCSRGSLSKYIDMPERADDWQTAIVTKEQYDNAYTLSIYVNVKTPLDIICRKHGVFKQIPSDHLNGVGCPKCGGSYNYDTEHFIKLARSIHGFKYDYSITKYNTAHSFVKIVCPEHGVFEQKASGHLTGKGCRKCAKYGFNTSEKGYVYFLISECSMFIKVGITKSLNRRLKELKTATPFKFSLFKFYELDGQSCVHIEKYFHTSYEKANLKDFDGSTEWLKYSKELMNDIL